MKPISAAWNHNLILSFFSVKSKKKIFSWSYIYIYINKILASETGIMFDPHPHTQTMWPPWTSFTGPLCQRWHPRLWHRSRAELWPFNSNIYFSPPTTDKMWSEFLPTLICSSRWSLIPAMLHCGDSLGHSSQIKKHQEGEWIRMAFGKQCDKCAECWNCSEFISGDKYCNYFTQCQWPSFGLLIMYLREKD